MISQLALNFDSLPGYTLTDGILCFHGRICLGSNLTLQHRVLQAMHAGAIGGHSGIQVTYSIHPKM
jgi:hypothetical protein